MRWRRCAGMRGRGRAGPPAPAPPTRCRRSRRRQPRESLSSLSYTWVCPRPGRYTQNILSQLVQYEGKQTRILPPCLKLILLLLWKRDSVSLPDLQCMVRFSVPNPLYLKVYKRVPNLCPYWTLTVARIFEIIKSTRFWNNKILSRSHQNTKIVNVPTTLVQHSINISTEYLILE